MVLSPFDNEKEFEHHIRDLLEYEISAHEPSIRILESKGIADIVICRDGVSPAIFFIEVKYSARTPSGELNPISVSEGIQSEILKERPKYLERHFLWLLGSGRRSCADYYWLLTSRELLPYITTKPLGEENNISLNIFRGSGRKYRLDAEELSISLGDRLMQTA